MTQFKLRERVLTGKKRKKTARCTSHQRVNESVKVTLHFGKKNEKNSRSVPWNACITQKCNWKMQVTQKKQHLQLHSMQSLKQSDHFPCTFSYRANGEFEFESASNCFASSIIFDDGSGFCITLTHQIISQSIPFSSYHYDVICVYTFSCCAAALVFTSIFLLSQSMDTKITTSDTDTHVNWTTINC